jgi:hypothetical protein
VVLFRNLQHFTDKLEHAESPVVLCGTVVGISLFCSSVKSFIGEVFCLSERRRKKFSQQFQQDYWVNPTLSKKTVPS